MTEADILALRIQATRVDAVRRDLKAIQGDMARMRQMSAAHAAASRSHARTIESGYDSLARSARRSADAQKRAMQGVRDSVRSTQGAVMALAGSYLGFQGIKAVGGAALDAANTKFRQEATMRALAPGQSGALMRTGGRLAERYGAPIGGVREMMMGLAASPIDPSKVAEFAEALTVLGSTGTADDMREFARQLRQAAGSGMIQGDELRIMAERLPILGKALEEAGLSLGKLRQMSQKGDPLGFEEFSKIILDYAKSPTMKQLSSELASSNAAQYQRMLNQWQVQVLEPLGAELGPALLQFGRDAMPSAIAAAKALGSVAVFAVQNWKPLALVALVVKGAHVAMAVSAWRASAALNALAASGGARALAGGAGAASGGGVVAGAAGGIRGAMGRVGGWARGAWGSAGIPAGTGATTWAAQGGSGVARVMVPVAGAGAASGSAGSGMAGLLASSVGAGGAGAVAGAVITAAAVAVGSYLATKYGLDALARATGAENYEDKLRRMYAQSSGATIDKSGNEVYGATDARAKAMFDRTPGSAAAAKRKAWLEREARRKALGEAGLSLEAVEAAEARARQARQSENARRPANRTTIQNRIARENASTERRLR